MSTQDQELETIGNSNSEDMDAGFSAFAQALDSGDDIEEPQQEVLSEQVEESDEGDEQQDESATDLAEQVQALQDNPNISKTEFDAQIRKLYGKIGELNSKLEQQARAPKLKIDAQKLARTGQYFDQDFAQGLAEDLNEAIVVEHEAPQQQAQTESVEERLQKQTHMAIVAGVHPDFREIVGSPAWNQWKQSLPVITQQELDSSWDSSFINPMLTRFKQAISNQQAKQTNNTQRLANAITPKGGQVVAKTGLTESDGFSFVAKQLQKELGA